MLINGCDTLRRNAEKDFEQANGRKDRAAGGLAEWVDSLVEAPLDTYCEINRHGSLKNYKGRRVSSAGCCHIYHAF